MQLENINLGGVAYLVYSTMKGVHFVVCIDRNKLKNDGKSTPCVEIGNDRNCTPCIDKLTQIYATVARREFITDVLTEHCCAGSPSKC